MNTVKTFLHPIKNTVGHLICLIFLLNSLRIFIQNNTILSFYCVHSNIEQIGKSMTISQSESASFNDMSVFKENQVKVPKTTKLMMMKISFDWCAQWWSAKIFDQILQQIRSADEGCIFSY